jgi:hypothetical protein
VTYLIIARDPRDVAISFAHHATNIDREAFSAIVRSVTGERGTDEPRAQPPPSEERLRRFVDDDEDLLTAPITLAGVLDHVR